MTDPALQLNSLSVHFGGVVAVADVTLTVAPGERRGIIGPNGAGKTTLFNLVSGWIRPTSGSIVLHGTDVTGSSPDRLARVGLTRTFQRTQLCGSLSIRDNVELAVQAKLRILDRMWRPTSKMAEVRQRAGQILDDLGMSAIPDVPSASLSYGVQRQSEVAMAIATQPSVLLLDEPTSGLSPAETHEMAAFLSGLPGEMTMLIVEHDMDVVFGIAERVLVMNEGRVLADGTPDEIRGSAEVQLAYMGRVDGG